MIIWGRGWCVDAFKYCKARVYVIRRGCWIVLRLKSCNVPLVAKDGSNIATFEFRKVGILSG
jgi:hypothetical protein